MTLWNKSVIRSLLPLVACLAILPACASHSSESGKARNDESSRKSGQEALIELNQMAKSISIGSLCRLASENEGLLNWSFERDGNPDESYVISASSIAEASAERVVKNRVPYWRFNGRMTASSDEVVGLTWEIREDTNLTTEFSIVDDSGATRTDFKECQN